jgi:hypothetical protein
MPLLRRPWGRQVSYSFRFVYGGRSGAAARRIEPKRRNETHSCPNHSCPVFSFRDPFSDYILLDCHTNLDLFYLTDVHYDGELIGEHIRTVGGVVCKVEGDEQWQKSLMCRWFCPERT